MEVPFGGDVNGRGHVGGFWGVSGVFLELGAGYMGICFMIIC